MNRQGSTRCVGCDVITGVGHLKQILHNTLSFLSFREQKSFSTCILLFSCFPFFFALNKVLCNCFAKRTVLKKRDLQVYFRFCQWLPQCDFGLCFGVHTLTHKPFHRVMLLHYRKIPRMAKYTDVPLKQSIAFSLVTSKILFTHSQNTGQHLDQEEVFFVLPPLCLKIMAGYDLCIWFIFLLIFLFCGKHFVQLLFTQQHLY